MQEILQQAFEAPAPTPAPVASVVPATQDYYAATPAPSMPAAPQPQMPLPPPPAQPWQAPSYAVTAPADNSQWNAASDLPTRRAPAAAVLPPSPMPVRAVQTSPFAIAGGDALDGQSPPWAVAH